MPTSGVLRVLHMREESSIWNCKSRNHTPTILPPWLSSLSCHIQMCSDRASASIYFNKDRRQTRTNNQAGRAPTPSSQCYCNCRPSYSRKWSPRIRRSNWPTSRRPCRQPICSSAPRRIANTEGNYRCGQPSTRRKPNWTHSSIWRKIPNSWNQTSFATTPNCPTDWWPKTTLRPRPR